LTPYYGTGCTFDIMRKKRVEKTPLFSGEVARLARVNGETLRYYERHGFLEKPPRSESGYRIYPPEAVQRIRFIKRAQALGFSLREIKELLALSVGRNLNRCSEVRRRAEEKLASAEEKIRALRALKRALQKLISSCHEKKATSECPILETLDEGENNHE
jgi:Hg(II)-responsive transcriptional regulator